MIGNYDKKEEKEDLSSKTCIELLQIVIKRKLLGVMIHDDMQNYFDFLDTHGFKREQEIRTFDEMAEFKGLCRYLINNHDKMPDKDVESIDIAPLDIKKYTSRMSVPVDMKKQMLKKLFETWLEWEKETSELFEEITTLLAKTNHNVDAVKVRELLKGSRNEIKYVERRLIEYNNVEWDLHHIYCIQDEIHEKMKDETRSIYKIDIC